MSTQVEGYHRNRVSLEEKKRSLEHDIDSIKDKLRELAAGYGVTTCIKWIHICNNNLHMIFGVTMQPAGYEVRTLDGKKTSGTMS